MSKDYLVVDDIVIDPDVVDRLQQSVIATRDAALKQNLLDWAFELSLVVAVIGDYKKRIQPH